MKIQLLIIKTLTAAAVALSGSLVFAANHTVAMNSVSYEPKVLEIQTGDSVEWINKAYTEHSATGASAGPAPDANKFDTGLIQPGKSSKEIAFKEAGTFEYNCSVHGKTMHGKIVVKK